LNGTIVAGMFVLFHRCRTARIIPCRALTHFVRGGIFLAPVYDRSTDGFCDCGHADRASPARLAPAASSVPLICWRRPGARNSPWALPSGSKQGDSLVAAGQRSRGSHVDEGGAGEWDMPDGVAIASTSVARFIRMITAAPRSTARLSPRAVAMAPSTRASAPIDR